MVGFRFASLCRHSSLPFLLNFSNLVKPHYSNVEKFCRHFYAMVGFRFASLCRNALNGSKGKATACQGEGKGRHAKLPIASLSRNALNGEQCQGKRNYGMARHDMQRPRHDMPRQVKAVRRECKYVKIQSVGCVASSSFGGKLNVKGGGGTNRSDAGLNLSGSWQQGHSATYNTPSRI